MPPHEPEPTGFIIRLVADALTGIGPTEPTYLSLYDPDGFAGRGLIRSTRDVRRALLFPDQVAALACWTRQSRTHPLRHDGKPNKPLTAYTVEVVPVAFAAALR